MIGSDLLAQAVFDVTLPANAPARLAPPPKLDTDPWWRIGRATWVRALPERSVQVQNPDERSFTLARFRTDGPGIEVDEDADWARASDAVKGLAAELVEGILRQLDASVPALPTRARPIRSTKLQLDWPGAGSGMPDARRRHRLAGSAALVDYLERAARDDGVGNSSDPGRPRDLAGRLVHQLSAIPRPAETRLSLSCGAGEVPVLSWEQEGNPELLWAASEVSWSEMSCNVIAARLPLEEADGRNRLGAGAHLLAMATALEAATGGAGVPLRLRYCSAGDRPVTATITISPGQWGFDLPKLVQGLAQGIVPEGLSFRNTG